jgi:choice-of-anchor A domain-containing protein
MINTDAAPFSLDLITGHCPYSPNLGAGFSGATGHGHFVGPWPDVQGVPALGKADGRDDSVAFFVGGNYHGNLGAEIEGKIVVLGNFINNGISSLVQVGLGSQIIPNNDQYVILVRGNWEMNVDVAVMQNSAYVRGNIKYKGASTGNTHKQLWTNGRVEHDPDLDLTVYDNALKELKVKSAYWASRTMNGIFIPYQDSSHKNTAVFKAGNDDCVQVFNLHDYSLSWVADIQFHENLKGKTILINYSSDTNGHVRIQNLANFYDPWGRSGWKFDSAMTASILWNFHDASQVYLGFGYNGVGELEFRGSILVPHGSLDFEIPGHAGRCIVGGDLTQNFEGSEFHNYPFEPNDHPNCQLPLPHCDPEPTPVPTKLPNPHPSKMPTPHPANKPTPHPTKMPPPHPTKMPTPHPTHKPTPHPTSYPTFYGNCHYSPNLGNGLSGATGQDHFEGPWPNIQSAPFSGNAVGRDDSVAILVGRTYIAVLGAGIEGKIVVLRTFGNLSVTSLVQTLSGSQMLPNNDQDVILVGRNFIMNVDVAVMQYSANVRGNIKYRGDNKGTAANLLTNGSVERVPDLDLTFYEKALEELKVKSSYWASLTMNGIYIPYNQGPYGNTAVFKAGNNTDCVQIFNLGSDELDSLTLAIRVVFHKSLRGKTILINYGSDVYKQVQIKNLVNFYDPWYDGGLEFDSATTASILWNFYDAEQVDLVAGADGVGEFIGSILVPNGSMNFEMKGHSGRLIIGLNLIQDFEGSEFHNYPFEPNPHDASCQLPIPPYCT